MEYTLVRSRRKTLAVQVALDGSVTVRAPLRLSQAKIDRFLQEKEAWIARTVETQKQRAAARPVLTDEDCERLRRLAKEVLPGKVERYAALMGVAGKIGNLGRGAVGRKRIDLKGDFHLFEKLAGFLHDRKV